MQSESETFTISAVIAAASAVLEENSFIVSRGTSLAHFPRDRSLLAEDAYGVIALVAYDNWDDLAKGWADAQAELVSLIAKQLSRSEPKAWDGYLVLVCTGVAIDQSAVSAIERDTARVRKFVITADVMQTYGDIRRFLDPLMPLSVPSMQFRGGNILATLPDLLQREVPKQAVEIVINAFKNMDPPLERLSQWDGFNED